jgi:hypothetical protein
MAAEPRDWLVPGVPFSYDRERALLIQWIDELGKPAGCTVAVFDWLQRALEVPHPVEVDEWLVEAINAWCAKPRSGRPPESRYRLQVRQALVGGCNALIGHGSTARDAARPVARLANRLKIKKADGSKVSDATVYDWWRELRETAGCTLLGNVISGAGGDFIATTGAIVSGFLTQRHVE